MVLKTELFVPSHIKCTNGEKFFKTKVKSLILQKGINLKQNSDMLYYQILYNFTDILSMLSYEYSGSVYIAVYSITSTVIVMCTNLTHFVIQLKLN